MATKSNFIDSITIYNKYKACIFKIKILRMWRMPNFKDWDQIDLIDMDGIVKGKYSESQWSCRGCSSKNCFAGVREKDDRYHWWKYEDYASFVFRYLRLRFIYLFFWKSDFFHFMLILIIELPRLTLMLMLVWFK